MGSPDKDNFYFSAGQTIAFQKQTVSVLKELKQVLFIEPVFNVDLH